MNYIKGKVVLITGAASGFGRLIAGKTAAQGALVVAVDINEQELAASVEHIEAAGGQACALVADVTRLADMSAMVMKSVERFGRVDVLVNNAGTMPLAFYADHVEAAEAWHRCIDINIKGVLNGIIAVYDQMIEQGQGQVINLSSIYGNYPVKGAAVYGATKAAVNVLSESLRQETQGRIKVTNVRPTGVPTTGITGGVVNVEAAGGIMGANETAFIERFTALMEGNNPAQWLDPDRVEYFSLAPELLADQVVYAMNQPWGVSISDITVRASGDMYVI